MMMGMKRLGDASDVRRYLTSVIPSIGSICQFGYHHVDTVSLQELQRMRTIAGKRDIG